MYSSPSLYKNNLTVHTFGTTEGMDGVFMRKVLNWTNGSLWRQVLFLFLACLLCTTLWAQAGQEQLADHVIRLHVVANSDSESDQAVKLRVRDDVLREAEARLAACTSREEAGEILQNAIPSLTRTAAETLEECGCETPVQVTLGKVWYPSRYTGTYALPAGEYTSLRVIIGEGAGHNWWGVLFPSLCLPAVTEQAVPAMGLTESDLSLLTEETPVYHVKFRTAELISSLLHRFQQDSSCAGTETVID